MMKPSLFAKRNKQDDTLQLLDRMSFLRFTRLADTSQIPDRTTIWTFKERLIKASASGSVFDAINRQLARHGYIARGGQIIDPSIVQVPKQSLHDTNHFEDVLADKGYVDGERTVRLTDAGWRNWGGKTLRGIDLGAALHLNWTAAAYNLGRWCYLKEARIEAF